MSRSARAYYSAPVFEFLKTSSASILGTIVENALSVDEAQRAAWRDEIVLLKDQLAADPQGHLYLEFVVPRVGRRADAVVVKDAAIFVIEFKVGAKVYAHSDQRQAEGYAVDLKSFHETSASAPIIPILLCTSAEDQPVFLNMASDRVAEIILSNGSNLGLLLTQIACVFDDDPLLPDDWSQGAYRPTPTIVEAAQYLYAHHEVTAITRSESTVENLTTTTDTISEIVERSRARGRKSICFVTGVPGAGKTLAGLDIATRLDDHSTSGSELAVFLSGNGPLVKVLREALARDAHERDPLKKKIDSRRLAGRFIQNVHHFRDEYLIDTGAPVEHVAVFDEAQRAWDHPATASFMSRKRGRHDFNMSEPEFLIEVMDRHEDWSVVVALIGGGQEINTGEAGLKGWTDALQTRFSNWDVYFSEQLSDRHFSGNDFNLELLHNETRDAVPRPGLHLSTSLRSFRAENLSQMIHHLVHNDPSSANEQHAKLQDSYPIFVTRDVDKARGWVEAQNRGFETRGLLASSGGLRLRPDGIQVKNTLEQEHWFLNGPGDVRSSHALELVATEFDVQGLELDWALIGWDGDLRYVAGQFEHWQFKGTKWQKRNQEAGRRYLENAYRVLLTRARQGMVIFVPSGSLADSTRHPGYYDGTYEYLRSCGIRDLPDLPSV